MNTRARRDDPWTSHHAGDLADAVVAKHYRIILQALAAGPGISWELANRCELSNAQIHKRMPELERLGLVARTGEIRLWSRSRRPCLVWQRVEPGETLPPRQPALF